MRETAIPTEAEHSLLATLDRLARTVEAAGIGALDGRERGRLQRQALTLAQSQSGGPLSASVSAVNFVAGLLGDIAVDLAADIPGARRLVAELEQETDLPAAAVGHELLRISHVSQLPPDLALHVQLALLLIFSDTSASSLWICSAGGQLRRVGEAGSVANHDQAEQAVRGLVDSARKQRWAHADGLIALLMERGRRPAAALVLHGAERRSAKNDLLLEAAAPVISATLDRIELLATGALDGPAVTAALERRLARLRYDLHDGPQQDVHLLGLDLRLFRDQLTPVLDGQPHSGRLLGRLDDLEAQLVALDSELRHIATSMQSPFLPAGSLAEALEAITEAFASRSGVEPEVELSGDLASLSDSQQITLLALVREALNNVQKHSGAQRVTITIAAHSGGVDAQITDDGRGFDPEQALVKAAREGHLGVVGIHERVRMLGGHARIESRPGGPTVISVSLPLWKTTRA